MSSIDQVIVELGAASYSVIIGSGVLTDENHWIDQLNPDGALIVSNTTVAALYLQPLQQLLEKLDIPHGQCLLPDGEQYKTTQSWQKIIDALLELPANRKSTVIALGGGVIGDMAGFAAACYMRGIRVIQVPTTLLAQVDASVGGKTGVNLPSGKNLVGAFHQPSQVIADIDTLKTLGDREYRAGIAEVIKYGLIMDSAFFQWLDKHAADILQRQDDVLQHMVTTSVQHKASVVTADVLEQGQRALLNFGHTFGHALETLTDYSYWLHGEAVAIGMLLACEFGENIGFTPKGTATSVERLLQAMEFDLTIPSSMAIEHVIAAMHRDKKASSTGMDLILLSEIGAAQVSSGHNAEQLRRYFPGHRFK